LVPLLGIVSQLFLAVYLFTFSPRAWFTAGFWIVGGLLAYYAHFSRVEELEKPKDILHEEVLVSRDYSVVVPVASMQQARVLGHIGSVLAQDHGGEVMALYVVRVPPQLTLADGRLFLREGRPYLEKVIEAARRRDVPVHTMIRLGRDVAEAVRKTAIENASDLIVLAWPGYTGTAGRLFGSVIDPVIDDPPTDIAVVRYREYRPLRKVLVPVDVGSNSRRAIQMAISMARQCEECPVTLTAMHVIPVHARERDRIRARQIINQALEGNPYEHLETLLAECTNVVDAILTVARDENYDLIVLGAAEESLFESLFLGNVPRQVAERADVTVIMVKRRSSVLRSILHQTVLPPPTPPDDGASPTTEG
jgi:nucleotide-binding universal stress UspA family protein